MRIKKPAKYRNVKTVVDGITFDSKREAERYGRLKLLQRAGRISDLKLQVEFVLFPSYIENGKVIERAWKYVADFVYTENGRQIIEDAKGKRTAEYIGKRKAMLAIHNIRIREV